MLFHTKTFTDKKSRANSAPYADYKSRKSARLALRKAQKIANIGNRKNIGSDVSSALGPNILRRRKELGLTQESLALMIDWDSGNISRVERGEQYPNEHRLAQIADALKCSISELFVSDVRREISRKIDDDTVDIPSLNAIASMGLGVALPEYDEVIERMTVSKAWLKRNVSATKEENLALITGYGDSMEGTFSDGDLLLVDRGVVDIKLDAVYVLSLNNELYIKRIQRRPDGSVLMISDNKKYEPYIIKNGERDNFRVLGRVLLAWNATKL